MADRNIVAEALLKAEHSLGFAVGDLRAANRTADPVLHLLLLPLIAEARALQERITAARSALESKPDAGLMADLIGTLRFYEKNAHDGYGRGLGQPATEALGKIEHAGEGYAAPWRLFSIHAVDVDGTHAFIVSAQSDSEANAQELAEAAVLEDVGTESQPGAIESTTSLGTIDRDVFEKVGTLA